jgi:hypothetical protein
VESEEWKDHFLKFQGAALDFAQAIDSPDIILLQTSGVGQLLTTYSLGMSLIVLILLCSFYHETCRYLISSLLIISSFSPQFSPQFSLHNQMITGKQWYLVFYMDFEANSSGIYKENADAYSAVSSHIKNMNEIDSLNHEVANVFCQQLLDILSV